MESSNWDDGVETKSVGEEVFVEEQDNSGCSIDESDMNVRQEHNDDNVDTKVEVSQIYRIQQFARSLSRETVTNMFRGFDPNCEGNFLILEK